MLFYETNRSLLVIRASQTDSRNGFSIGFLDSHRLVPFLVGFRVMCKHPMNPLADERGRSDSGMHEGYGGSIDKAEAMGGADPSTESKQVISECFPQGTPCQRSVVL
jgi:hypothetical protein